MSDFRIDQITNQAGTAGPNIAGIATFNSTSGLIMPSGNIANRYFRNKENIVTEGLVINLDAGNQGSYIGSEINLYDISGNNNHAKLFGGASFENDGGGCISLNGTNGYISCGTGQVGSSTMTTETWIKKKGDNGHFMVIDNYDQPELRLTFNSSGWLIQYYDNGGYFTNTTYTTFIDPNYWYHIVTAIQNGSQKYYINGVEVLSTKGTYDGNSTSNVFEHTLGTYNRPGTGYNGYANVKISSHRVYRKVLSEKEILQNFNALRYRYGI